MKKNNRLKELRKQSKLTQEQLAQYLGIDQTTIAKIENGSRSITTTSLEKLCALFGCSESYFLGEDDKCIPLLFSFSPKELETKDLESIAALNRITLNTRHMNEILVREIQKG